jgi:hypothetical protein
MKEKFKKVVLSYILVQVSFLNSLIILDHDLNLPIQTSKRLIVKSKLKTLKNIAPDNYILPLAYLGIISKIIWVKTNESQIIKRNSFIFNIQAGKYEFEVGNIENTDDFAVNNKDLLEFFTSYSPELTNKKTIYLEVIDIDQWNAKDDSDYEKLIRVPGDTGSLKPPILFYNQDLLFYQNPSEFPAKKLRISHLEHYTKWKLSSSYCFKTAKDSKKIRRFFDTLFLSERQYKKIDVYKLSKPIQPFWCEGVEEAKKYFKTLQTLVGAETIGLTILTKGNLPAFHHSTERIKDLFGKVRIEFLSSSSPFNSFNNFTILNF